jgi:hypothetical protein
VNNSNNKIFLVEQGNAVLEATIANGLYTNSTYPTAVKAALDGVSAGAGGIAQVYTVSLTALTNKLTIQANNNFGLRFAGRINTAHECLGFNKSDTSMNTTNIHVAPNMINLSAIHTINVSIDGISEISQRNLQSTSFIIPIPAGALAYVNYISSESFEQTVDIHSDKRIIHVTLRDELNNLIDLNGVDWLLILEKITPAENAL